MYSTEIFHEHTFPEKETFYVGYEFLCGREGLLTDGCQMKQILTQLAKYLTQKNVMANSH